MVEIKVKNISSDTLSCTPFIKDKRWDITEGVSCDTMDYATYTITCNHCDKWDMRIPANYKLAFLCGIHMNSLSRLNTGVMRLYLNNVAKKIIAFRVFSKSQNKGIKLYLPLNIKYSKMRKGITLTDIKAFDE